MKGDRGFPEPAETSHEVSADGRGSTEERHSSPKRLELRTETDVPRCPIRGLKSGDVMRARRRHLTAAHQSPASRHTIHVFRFDN
jgi:hypothetical protein